jgi:cyclopropane-fatty-acyl-phospholipid synthase
MSKERALVARILKAAGVEVNGPNPWDIQVHDERLYRRVISQGSLGLGEAYMEGWWDCDRIDLLIEKILRTGQPQSMLTLPVIWLGIKARVLNMQTKVGAKKVIEKHYDLSNELYASFLDPYKQYSCGYFKGTEDLNIAQEQKMDLICRKLQLKNTDRVLDIGCGWGGFAKYAAEKYGCTVVGITISDEQIAYAKEFTAGLPVEIRKQDYRDLNKEQFDKIVSVGMLEHVGYKNYRKYLEIAHASLKDNGLFLLHTIGQNISGTTGDPWADKYIFPHGMLPSIAQLGKASEMLLIMEDWHNFGPYYHKTLLAWDQNFQKNWDSIKEDYSETFYRMFRYYFNSFAGAFKSREIQLWQIVLSKGRKEGVYEAAR